MGILGGNVGSRALLAAGCWVGYQLLRQRGRILIRLESIEERLEALAPPAVERPGPQAQGLRPGSMAPPFELPSLSGAPVSLNDFRGQRVLLMFFNPGCGFCEQMAPDVVAFARERADGAPLPLVVSVGGADANRALFDSPSMAGQVLLQQQSEVASRYEVGGTPMGYLVDEHGEIASELAVGADALMKLAGAPDRTEPPKLTVTHSLTDSRIKRDGLSAGTRAPYFRVPRVGGGELALDDYAGRRILLVFSDPDCGPCQQLLPRLERLHATVEDLEVVMISRGDAAANEAKVIEHRLSFPVGLQKGWRVSRDYAYFAAPVAYLIDEHGTIAADVAVGPDAILALTLQPPNGSAPVTAWSR